MDLVASVDPDDDFRWCGRAVSRAFIGPPISGVRHEGMASSRWY